MRMNSTELSSLYCNSLTRYSRYIMREVRIGDIVIGGLHPIRVQSMTTTDTMDTRATVEQSIRMIEAGCELVRITAPSINEAKNLEVIKAELRKQGYHTPLVADIHFTPNAAELAARLVEKVRVNPGNYADKKKFETLEYTDATYADELERIRERFTPLVKICKEYGTAMRIGTNHGSLSDRILSRYGDTPLGMVESALEFIRICEDNNFYNIVLSMKSSNPQVMVQAYRLLVSKMQEEEMNYPLHLGVTEAGDGEDGRIKSSVGIGTLLEDGLGDTIRVSLTEDPEFEIPVAKALVNRYSRRQELQNKIPPVPAASELRYSPFAYNRRISEAVLNIGNQFAPVVFADLSKTTTLNRSSFLPFGYRFSEKLDKWNLSDQAADFIYTGNSKIDFEIPGTLGIVVDSGGFDPECERHYPLYDFTTLLNLNLKSPILNFIRIRLNEILDNNFPWQKIDSTCVLILSTSNPHGMAEQRRFFFELMLRGIRNPVIIHRGYQEVNSGEDSLTLDASTDLGALFIDGFGDGIWIEAPAVSLEKINKLSFGILQATRMRISRTEYISCPSCGRTLFDLQETTAKIRARTSHLKGVKIGIMGCIVNGPGEMADADYGYVGTGPGKITLYKGKEVVRRNIDSESAVDALIDLIRLNGDWVEVAEHAE